MWCETQARSPRARQKALLSSAPQASEGGALHGQRDARGHVAARAAHHQRLAAQTAQRAHHRVVGADLDRAVVDEEEVGDPFQARHRVVVAVGDRLVRDVAAGHHQRRARRRRAAGGEVASRAASPRGRASREPPTRPPRASARRRAITIGRSRPSKQPLLRAVSSTSARALSRSGAISANGLSSRCLRARSAATAPSSIGAGRPGGSRRAPSRPRPTLRQRRSGLERPHRPVAAVQRERRPAVRARVGLGVEAPVGGVLVLGPAGAAHLEARHRGERAVVRAPRGRS